MNAIPVSVQASCSDMQREIRPLLLVNNLDVGGAQIAVLNLAIGLLELGYAPLVHPWKRGGALEERFRKAGVPIELPEAECNGWSRLAVPRRLRVLARRHDVNLIHAHMSDAAAWAALLQRSIDLSCVVSHHTTDLIDTVGIGRPVYGWTRRRLLSLCSRSVSHNIAVSSAVRDRLIAESRLDGSRVTVIENGLPLPPAERVVAAAEQRRVRAEQGFSSGGPVVLAVGRLTREKGFDALIEAAPALRSVYPYARIRIVGDGPYRSALLESRARLGLEEVVELPGFASDVGVFLEAADVFAAPSHIEGLPLAVLEAMSWAVPVVVSNIEGHRDLVSPGSTGMIFPVGDATALANALLLTLSGGRAAGERAARALRDVRDHYSATAMARRHIETYRTLIGIQR